jgi:protein arginine kinase activator
MKCQRCPQPASVHLTERRQGERLELHLCAACAQQAGLDLPQSPPDLKLDAVVDHLIATHVGELVGKLAQLVCPACGTHYMEFRTHGRLGCPQDYRVFASGLAGILPRYHGASRHVGKRPRGAARRDGRLELRAQLREAVAREDYEQAARLRDQLRAQETQS